MKKRAWGELKRSWMWTIVHLLLFNACLFKLGVKNDILHMKNVNKTSVFKKWGESQDVLSFWVIWYNFPDKNSYLIYPIHLHSYFKVKIWDKIGEEEGDPGDWSNLKLSNGRPEWASKICSYGRVCIQNQHIQGVGWITAHWSYLWRRARQVVRFHSSQ